MQTIHHTSLEDLTFVGHELTETHLAFVSGGKSKGEKKVYIKTSCDTDKKCRVEAGFEWKF